MKEIAEFLNFPIFLGIMWAIKKLLDKIELLTTEVVILKEDKRRKDEEEFCKPVHVHEERFHHGDTHAPMPSL